MSHTTALSSNKIRNAVIRLAGNSQDGIQSIGAFSGQLAGSNAWDIMTYMPIPSTIFGSPSIFQVHLGSIEAAMRLTADPSPGKFGVYDEAERPTKNELEREWLADAQSKIGNATQKDLLRRRFASMR